MTEVADNSNGDHSKSPVYIAKSEVCLNEQGERVGDGLFAGVDFGPGEQVTAVKRPILASLDTERLSDTCANCFVWTEGSSMGARLYVPEGTRVHACAGCRMVRYCSKKCQKEAWTRVHKYECKNLQPLASRDIPKAVRACMEILIRRKQGLIPDPAWEMLCHLNPHVEDFQQNGSYAQIELMAMGASAFSFTENTYSKEIVAAMYARVLSNSLTLITPTLDPLGIILDPTLSHINHSCDPNAYIMMDGPEVAVRTIKPIKKDEEIYISYVDNTNPCSRRQSELKTRWFFTCKCSKCQKGATLDEDKWAIRPKNLAKKHKEVADLIIQHEAFAKDPANYVGESLDEKRVAAIQGKSFAEYEDVQRIPDPAAAMQKIEDGMRLCHQSKLWPVYRQPYAAFRDDLIVTMFAVGKYQIAWAQCAKRYKYIIAKLYPIHFHPVRVVQTWQMAMLALYLADTEGIVGAPDVNMGLIAMMLVKQVLDASRLSHGPNSAFTQSVQMKADELSEEVRASMEETPNRPDLNKVLEVQRDMLSQMGDWIQY
ncbi:SET domain-containing protein [Dothidotthia symphoricarpi CBS 119687]|uniref:SET domain-containing protein n=1 Tax=Dothidotthia symphoricarpi CBS 119687 TaxID=1392245 RepID=A0A6A6AP90_9PLEO|nr:SET domain-containing protein [Dothidotthia symphoricarpi CBS 119687]KAF2133003.1 SET domain-containing protein [Dothidotthia symphoricarpi CBS 119687]